MHDQLKHALAALSIGAAIALFSFSAEACPVCAAGESARSGQSDALIAVFLAVPFAIALVTGLVVRSALARSRARAQP